MHGSSHFFEYIQSLSYSELELSPTISLWMFSQLRVKILHFMLELVIERQLSARCDNNLALAISQCLGKFPVGFGV